MRQRVAARARPFREVRGSRENLRDSSAFDAPSPLRDRYPALALLLVLLHAAAGSPLAAQETRASASVSADVVGVNDQFQLTVTVYGSASGDTEAPRLGRLPGFQVVAGPSISTQFQWINGRGTSSRAFIYVLLPEKEGEFTIDPIEVRVGGKILRTEPIPLRVTSTSTQPPRARPRSSDPFEDDFLRSSRAPAADEILVAAELDRNSAYVGQQVTLTYHLLTQVGVTGIQLQESPPLTGFWVEDIEVPTNPSGSRRIFEGREYLDFVVKRQAIFPNAPGTLKIPPFTFAISARSTGGIFGVFGQPETVYRKTRELSLEARALPEAGRPPGFKNAVGAFNLTAALDKPRAATGEAVALLVRLAGRGNLKLIPDMAPPPLNDFTVYSSKRSENVRPLEANLVGGDKTWEFVLVPKVPGSHEIPALSFPYFDPDKRTYGLAATQPIRLEVVRGEGGSGASSALSGIGRQNLTRSASDINFIRLSAAGLESDAPPPYAAWWFYLLLVIPPAANAGILVRRRLRARHEGNAALVRRQGARKAALSALRNAEREGRREARRFYDTAAGALGGYLADRFNLPEIAVAGDTLRRTLASQGIEEEVVQETLSCLQECDFARFVDASASSPSRKSLAERIRRTIDALERD